MGGVVLEADVRPLVPEGDPCRFPTPLAVDEPIPDGEPRSKCLARARCLVHPASREAEVTHANRQVCHAAQHTAPTHGIRHDGDSYGAATWLTRIPPSAHTFSTSR